MNILQRLKEETSQQHKSLEDVKLLSHFTNNSITREVYLAILKKFYGFHSPLEKVIEAFNPQIYLEDYYERRKSNLLLQDLEKLSSAKESFLFCDDLPDLKSFPHAFGCLYVLEGSTLGGQIISRVLEKSLNITGDNGASYFNGYGKRTGERWKFFCSSLTKFSLDKGHDYQIVEGAVETFVKLKNWMEK